MAQPEGLTMRFDTATISIRRLEVDGAVYWLCRNEDRQSDGSITAVRQSYETARAWFDDYVALELEADGDTDTVYPGPESAD